MWVVSLAGVRRKWMSSVNLIVFLVERQVVGTPSWKKDTTRTTFSTFEPFDVPLVSVPLRLKNLLLNLSQRKYFLNVQDTTPKSRV